MTILGAIAVRVRPTALAGEARRRARSTRRYGRPARKAPIIVHSVDCFTVAAPTPSAAAVLPSGALTEEEIGERALTPLLERMHLSAILDAWPTLRGVTTGLEGDRFRAYIFMIGG